MEVRIDTPAATGAASADQPDDLSAHEITLPDAVRLSDVLERNGLDAQEQETPGLDQLADLGKRMHGAATIAAAEPHAITTPSEVPCVRSRSASSSRWDVFGGA
ncbi:MAG TPA: hypothetical protein VGQ31_14175, partial [Candidatus Limnocylindrales bacterium]|nr:hypothetical protein [Candidatus Limnocylindrales bacterium]